MAWAAPTMANPLLKRVHPRASFCLTSRGGTMPEGDSVGDPVAIDEAVNDLARRHHPKGEPLMAVVIAPLAEGIARVATEALTHGLGPRVSPERARGFERMVASVMLLEGPREAAETA